jgi:hypothetical protein
MRRRLSGGLAAAVVVATGLLAIGAGPAHADPPAISLSSPANDAVLKTAADVVMRGQAAQPNGYVDTVKLTLSSAEGYAIPESVKDYDYQDQNRQTVPISWSPLTPYNGHYTFVAAASGSESPIDFQPGEVSSVTRSFTVELPPAAPTGLQAIGDDVKRSITLTWQPNSEPDLVGYAVYRKSGATYQAVKTTLPDVRSYTDTLGELPAGTYAYQVRAVRRAATGNQAVVSAPASTTGKVTTAPPAPSTTTTRPGSGGSTATTRPPTGTTAPGSSGPSLATSGKVDLSNFAALLDDKSKLPAAPRSSGPQEIDNGFDNQLPFDRTTRTSIVGGDGDAQALGGQAVSASRDEPSSPLLFLAAGLLVTVLLMHVLWLKGEVEREPLPALAPSEPDGT